MEIDFPQDIKSFIHSKEFFNKPDPVMQESTIQHTSSVLPSETYYPTSEEMTSSDYLIAFSTKHQSYCVGMVDMVNSTKIASTLTIGKVSRYYQIFLNSMSKIVTRYGGVVIKNIGDSLLFYFPESLKTHSKFVLLSCLECSLAMAESQPIICKQLQKEDLTSVDYRISIDFGPVIIMKSNNSSSIDMIGPPVNICSKINRSANVNGIIIGGDMYERVKTFHDYCFKSQKDYSIGLKFSYPIYSITRRINA